MIDIKSISNIKILGYSQDEESYALSGSHNNENVIIRVKPLVSKIINLTKLQNTSLILDNDRFRQYMADGNSSHDILIICNPLDEDYEKYTFDRIKVNETYELYINKIYPKIINQNLSWMHNIINGISEKQKIVLNTNDNVLVKELKWSTDTMRDMYYLVIFKDHNLKSIRELNGSHVELLEKTRDLCIDKIVSLHNINKNKLRLYFHYHPTFWQLHLHINLIDRQWDGSSSDYAHPLYSVINNIKLVSNYYQLVTLDVKALKNKYD